MIKIKVIIILTVLLMTGCGKGFDAYECYSSVEKAYPSADIKRLQGSKYIFLVRLDNGEVRLIKTMNFSDPEITDDVIIFNAK